MASLKSRLFFTVLVVAWILVGFILLNTFLLDVAAFPFWVLISTCAGGLFVASLIAELKVKNTVVTLIISLVFWPFVWYLLWVGFGRFDTFRSHRAAYSFIEALIHSRKPPLTYELTGQVPNTLLNDVTYSYEIISTDSFWGTEEMIVEFENGAKYYIEIGNRGVFAIGEPTEDWHVYVAKR